MVELILSFIAGILTVFAPCVLPLLPVIVGGSLRPNASKYRPHIITASLVTSLIVFTLLLKVSTALIGIDLSVWGYISGGLVLVLGFVMLFPHLWDEVIGRLGIQAKSQELLGGAGRVKNDTVSAVLTGFALGPVFSSCSPTYSWVIATVLPRSTVTGVVYLIAYCVGVALALLAVALLGQKLLARIKWATNPKGWFQRTIAILFIIVGVMVITGTDKRLQTWLVEKDFLNVKVLEQELVPED